LGRAHRLPPGRCRDSHGAAVFGQRETGCARPREPGHRPPGWYRCSRPIRPGWVSVPHALAMAGQRRREFGPRGLRTVPESVSVPAEHPDTGNTSTADAAARAGSGAEEQVLPLVLRLTGRLGQRHVPAADGDRLAGAEADRQRCRARAGASGRWHPVAAAGAVGRHDRRPAKPAQAPHRHQIAYAILAGLLWGWRSLVPPEDLSSAVSLNDVIMNSARVIGPAAAGALIAAAGTTPCFGVNALSYLAVIAALLVIRPLRSGKALHRAGGVREGLRYAAGREQLRLTLAMMALVGLCSFNFAVILPVLIAGRGTLAGDPRQPGALLQRAVLCFSARIRAVVIMPCPRPRLGHRARICRGRSPWLQ
jgi:Transmembrane secretion effector